MNAKDIVITPEGKQGPRYRSMHDARPTAPNGTIWRVSKVEGDIVTLYAYNAWNRFCEETTTADMIVPFDERSVLTRQMLEDDFKRNGEMQMLSDIAEARRNGVSLTDEAKAYMNDVIYNNIDR